MTRPALVTAPSGEPGLIYWGYTTTGRPNRIASRPDINRALDVAETTGRAILDHVPLDETQLLSLLHTLEDYDDHLDRWCVNHRHEPAVVDGLCDGCVRGLDARDDAATAWDETELS